MPTSLLEQRPNEHRFNGCAEPWTRAQKTQGHDNDVKIRPRLPGRLTNLFECNSAITQAGDGAQSQARVTSGSERLSFGSRSVGAGMLAIQ